ncbi:lipase family protein [Alkalinema sp. FACHB-956]|uniref:lipase family protein n=1 Tax=Alkalinema sp. FACHB-956 TaxID=2692768 RepID=UPI001687DEC1|nr:lipase family protein [Alkalinema sp. FACHB-956]MBD2327905.1 lipase family protein [Alkalinema sp. FACHB-956]
MAIDYSKAVKYATWSQEVYQNFNGIQLSGTATHPFLINQSDTDTQCALLLEQSSLTIVFRGSESDIDWETNFETKQERIEFDQVVIREQIAGERKQIYPYESGGDSGALMHCGFAEAYLSVRDQIHDYLKTHDVDAVTTTGHSLGGALATLCAVDLQYNFKYLTIETYTFGAPKVGNDKFCESFKRRVPNSYRIVHGMDIVPEVPRWWQNYRSVDQEVRIGQRWSWKFISQRFKDHAIGAYIEILQTLAR